jgi:hypothetical protein
MTSKIPSRQPASYQEDVDRMKYLNAMIFEQTKIIVQQYGRNHCTGRNKSNN